MATRDKVPIDLFQRLDVRVGVILSVEDAIACRNPSYKLRIDFGPEVGVKMSVARLTHYQKGELVGRQVLGVLNLPVKQIGPHLSEVLTLGVPPLDAEAPGEDTILIIPEREARIGGKVF